MGRRKINQDIEEVILKDKKEKINKYEFRTGSDLLDIVVGGGVVDGYPAGRIINLVGPKSSGKTFLACELLANAYYKYGKKFRWVYDDCESGFTFNTEELYGIKLIDENNIVKSNTVEELYCNFRSFLDSFKKGDFGIYVIDSLDGLSSKEMLERGDERYSKWKRNKEFSKGSYQMGAAKFLSQEFFRGLAGISQDKNVLLVIISQVRDNIDPMSFKKFVRSGGKALDHYCHTVLWLADMKKIKKNDRIIGSVIKAKLDKSKTPRPYRECIISVLFDYGLDNVGSNVDFLFDLRSNTGELLASSKSIIWEGGDIDLSSLKELISEYGLEDEWKDYKKENSGRKQDLMEFIKTNEKTKDLFNNKFGESKTRAELIEWIESNNKQEELRKRVEEKWGMIEESVKTKRVKKYSKA